MRSSDETDLIQIYHFEPLVEVLGPGRRCVYWLQGCLFNCPGCLVPDSHNPRGGNKVKIDDMVKTITALEDIEGITISGGEPFLQFQELAKLLEAAKKIRPELTVMLYTGYTYEALQKRKNATIEQIFNHTDILVDGLYLEKRHCNDAWRGSSNQAIYFLSNRYSKKDHLVAQTSGKLEVHLKNGQIFIAGIPPKNFNKNFDILLTQQGVF